MLHKNMPDIHPIFYCSICDYGCSKKSLYAQHIIASKHQNATDLIKNATLKNSKKIKNNEECSY